MDGFNVAITLKTGKSAKLIIGKVEKQDLESVLEGRCTVGRFILVAGVYIDYADVSTVHIQKILKDGDDD